MKGEGKTTSLVLRDTNREGFEYADILLRSRKKKMKKPRILFVDNLLDPIATSFLEISTIQQSLGLLKEPFMLRGTFVYVYSLFENGITECLKRFYDAFPEKISRSDTDLKVSGNVLSDHTFVYEFRDNLIEDFVVSMSYGKFDDFLKKFSEALSLPEYVTTYNKLLSETKERRNLLLHNNLVVNRLYIKKINNSNHLVGDRLEIDQTYLREIIDAILSLLSSINDDLLKKYQHYSNEKVLREVWDYLFSSPLLVFENHWHIKNGKIAGYNFTYAKKYASWLSTGEKTFLAYLLRNFDSVICDQLFKFSDIGMQASIDGGKLAFLVELFDKYPRFLQGDTSRTKIAKRFAHISKNATD